LRITLASSQSNELFVTFGCPATMWLQLAENRHCTPSFSVFMSLKATWRSLTGLSASRYPVPLGMIMHFDD
jgi:hypothetical protein